MDLVALVLSLTGIEKFNFDLDCVECFEKWFHSEDGLPAIGSCFDKGLKLVFLQWRTADDRVNFFFVDAGHTGIMTLNRIMSSD